MLSYAGILLLSALQTATTPTPEPRFLETVRIVSAHPAEGEVILLSADGERRSLRKGDLLSEERATLKTVTTATLTFTRRVTGGDGEAGESLIVVRFDASGKTTVREYRTVGDAAFPSPPKRKATKPKPNSPGSSSSSSPLR